MATSKLIGEALLIRDIVLKRYLPQDKAIWDTFVAGAKNGLFLFYRDYMDYHSDRFHDHSLTAYAEDRLIALLPAHLRGDTLSSHDGLTFGGWITDAGMKTSCMLLLFDRLRGFMKAARIKSLIYKCVPHIYHRYPAEEDVYALCSRNAHLLSCDVSTAINLRDPIAFASRRNRGLSKAEKSGVSVRQSTEYAAFYSMLSALLKTKYGRTPTHTLDELLLLASRFPENIRLFAAYRNASMLAGVTVYESAHVAHAQYIASTQEGRMYGALDALFNHLIRERYANKPYFDFGTSQTEGHNINTGLIQQKEEFGGRGIAQCVYEMVA